MQDHRNVSCGGFLLDMRKQYTVIIPFTHAEDTFFTDYRKSHLSTENRLTSTRRYGNPTLFMALNYREMLTHHTTGLLKHSNPKSLLEGVNAPVYVTVIYHFPLPHIALYSLYRR